MSYRFYFMPRIDMTSMTPGRIAAQATHAAHHFSHTMEHDYAGIGHGTIREAFETWKSETHYGFGTTIVLAPPRNSENVDYFNSILRKCLNDVNVSRVSATRPLIDPEYVLRDGETTHVIKDVMTGIWSFCDQDRSYEIFTDADLFDLNFK